MGNNPNIEDFIAQKLIADEDKGVILAELRELVRERFPHFTEGIKYGGLVFFNGEDLVGGVFVYKNWVTMEFGAGSAMNDPEGLLEGMGRARRHLKFRDFEDIRRKNADFYVAQMAD